MAKKLIRLTESDLHRIISNSVKRIIKEEEDLEALKARVKRSKKGTKAWLEAVRQYQAAKEKAGKANMIVNPDVYYSERENEKRGTAKNNSDRLFRTKGNMLMKRELDKETIQKAKERQMKNRAEFGDF